MTGLLTTVLAVPYLYRRKEVFYLRLRTRGVASDSTTISLRTFDKAVATKITADILKRLEEFHLGEPSATWKRLKENLHDIAQGCLVNAHGAPSLAAYGAGRSKLRGANGVSQAPLKKAFYITPQGVAEPGCVLQIPDYGNPEKGFSNPRGEYVVYLTIPPRAARPLIKQIVEVHEANYRALVAEFKKSPPPVRHGKKVLEPYEGDLPFFENGDGTVTFKFKRYASYVDQNTREAKPLPLKVVDSKGTSIANVPAIAGGSVLKVRFSMFPYGWTNVAGASMKLHLDSVMLIKLIESRSEDVWKDETVEGSYVYVSP
ncbi:hypothetical protein SAMN04488483_3312 [Pseudomonas helmanticensis]|uniref:Uncharacterized protein n=1 Tax=Pseudomonas helmanticensis TaxID=1471381 RepID=A0ACD2U7Q1_9PSED|nr:hypothetical protein [Pseudomonas helmanticensis]SMQ26940.1 hypothetical protein SAMN04488483_3312 [Pseudomonas helmanticensis]